MKHLITESPNIGNKKKQLLYSKPLLKGSLKKCVIKPFVKWAGGKGQLLSLISKKYPDGLGYHIKKYAEPFVGGGAVLFNILSTYDLDEVYISDINRELVYAYSSIKDNANNLIELLSVLQTEFYAQRDEGRKEYYYQKRDRFNDLKIKGYSIEAAALFIFLNKTCFNGLYRVNGNGLFNVPMGRYKTPLICDADNIKKISSNLSNVAIIWGDYRKSEKFIDSNTFVYFDPPYRPITSTANFTAYNENLFDDNAQRELAAFATQLNKKNAKIIISNSDPKNSNINDNFFDILYQGFNITRIEANRMINCNSTARGKITELLITNF